MTEQRDRLPTLITVAIPGEKLPENVERPFVERGFPWRRATTDEIEDGGRNDSDVFLFWVGADWDAGMCYVGRLAEEMRHRTILSGERKPGSRLIRASTRVGILAVVAHPVPDWFLAPLTDAIRRSRPSSKRRLVSGVKEIQSQIEQSPSLLLTRAAEVAGDLLCADLSVATLQRTAGDQFDVLVRSPGGRVLYEGWRESAERRRAPKGISRFVLEEKEITVIPSVLHSTLCEPGEGEEIYQSALVHPLHIQQMGIDGHQRPMLASLNLYWSKPRLPSPEEIVALEIVTALATSSLARLLEQARFSNIHAIARSVLTQPSEFHARLSQRREASAKSGRTKPSGDSLREYIELMIDAYSGKLGLREIWVRRPPETSVPEGGAWISLGSRTSATGPPKRGRESEETVEVVDVIEGDPRWAVQQLLKGDSPHLGEIVAIFDSQPAAWAAITEIQRLADDIFTAISLDRRARNTKALLQLSTVPSRPEEAHDDVRRVTEKVRDRTHSWGAKVFVVLRSVEGPKIWQMCNTDFPKTAPRPKALRAEQGLADWVLMNNDWLLVPQMQPADKTGIEKENAITGKNGKIRLLARPERDYWPEHKAPDEEQTMLFAPLHTGSQVTGVLAVWREEKIPYDRDFDTETLLYFAPHVAAACQRMLQLDKAEEELESVSAFAERLASASTLQEAYNAAVRGVGLLANAACAVLLHFDRDPPRKAGCLYRSALYSPHEDVAAAVSKKLERFKMSCDEDPAFWPLEVEDKLEKLALPLSFRGLVLPSLSNGDKPPLAAVLLDFPGPRAEPRLVSDDLLEHYARSFLQSAAAMLENQADSLASRLLDRIGPTPDGTEQDAGAVLAQSAELLKSALNADAVLIYNGTPRRMQLFDTWPRRRRHDPIVVKKGSFTDRSLKQRKPIRFLDTASHENKNDVENLETLAKAFRWKAVGSWLCCSVRHKKRSIGLIKILTRRHGRFLGKDHEKVVRVIAEKTAGEMYKANRQVTLTRLLHLSNRLSGLLDDHLEQQMTDLLKMWVAQMMHRLRCRVVVAAHTVNGQRLALARSKGATDNLGRLEEISLAAVRHPESSSLTKTSVADVYHVQRPKGIATPIALPGEERLKGHLFLLDDEPFAEDEMEAAFDAAHYMAVVLNSKRERVGWRETMGNFRHAVIGPVQGVGEIAMMLAEKTEEDKISTEEIRELRGMLQAELETVRLWRENGRFYLAEKAQLQLIKQPLKPLVDRVVKRFRTITQERNITLRLKWNLAGELQFIFDREALDLVISNLLDNAQKYAFWNREVTLGVDLDRMRELVKIWVEDIGHRIPKSIGQEIYRIGKRGSPHDPFRAILGQGLGLALVLNLVKAHDGELTHTCDQMTTSDVTETTPFRVRFTIELPYRRLS